MPIKLIVTDLDNTLLRRDKSVSTYTARVFDRCRAAGIIVVFATARHKLFVRDMVTALTPDLIISNGGALARQQEQVLYRRVLGTPTVNALLARCRTLGQTMVTTDAGYWTNAEHIRSPWSEFAWVVRSDFSHDFMHEAYHVGVVTPDVSQKEKLITDFPHVRTLAFSNEDTCAFYHPEATKARALAASLSMLGISMSEVVAFGDDSNEIDMLNMCGLGVAVANAIDDVKAVAAELCDDCDEDGVARWVEKHILS